MQTAIVSTNVNSKNYTLQWDQTTPWDNFPDLGSIYTQEIKVNSLDNYHYVVDFSVGDGRTLGLLFATVKHYNNGQHTYTFHYCFGQFTTNKGAMQFAQFAFNNFVETTNWAVCPSFMIVDYENGDAYNAIGGDEIVSKLI